MHLNAKLFNTDYEEELREFRLLISRGCAATIVAMILLGIFLDYAIYPQEQARFAIARIITSIIIMIAIAVLYTKFGRRHTQFITFFWLMAPQIMIAWMINVTKGEASLFYAGLLLIVFAVGILFPVGYWYTFLYGLLTLFTYYLACALRVNGLEDPRQFAFHAIIISFAVLGSTVYTFFNEKGREQLFQLKEEIALKNTALAKTNEDLSQIKGQMLQQEKMAAIGTLAAGLMHEINNPVNYCLMAINLALEEPVARASPTLLEYLVDSKEGMRRVQHIVSDLKSFAYRKPDTGKLGSNFLFQNTIETAIRFTTFELKGVEVLWDLPEDTEVAGDEAAIIGVLINLFNNAVLAMQKAKQIDMKIHIHANWTNNRLRVVVRDNGPGISPENLARVFEPFFTTREVGQGLGLGLSISYTVIEQHGGTLQAESVVGEWTQMIFDLPRANRGDQ